MELKQAIPVLSLHVIGMTVQYCAMTCDVLLCHAV